MHRYVPDGSAGKAQRLNDIRVGGKREPFARRCAQRRGVAELFQFLVAERFEEHRVDQGCRGFPAGAVGEGDDVVEETRAALPELVDPFQHTVFAVG